MHSIRFLAALALTATSHAGDQLLVAAYNSDSIARHDAASGAWLSNFAAGGQDGVLGIAIGPDGALYVCSENTNSVERFDAASGAHLGPFIRDDPATPVDESGGLTRPAGILFAPDDRLYVTSFDQSAIYEYDGRSGAFSRVLVASASGGLSGPDAGIALGPDGNLCVPSYFTNQIKRFDRSSGAYLGNFAGPITAGLQRPRTIVFPGDGFAYVASEKNDRIVQLDASTGAFVRNIVIDDPLTAQDETGGLDAPTGLAFGHDGRLYVASANTDQVLRYDSTSGAFVDVFVDAASGSDFPTFLVFRLDVLEYGPLAVNSFGAGATLAASGSSSIANADLALELHGAPPGEHALFFCGASAAQLPFGDGFLLVHRAPIRRLALANVDAFGRATHQLDFQAAASSSLPFLAGVARYFQVWTHDPSGPGGSGFNFSTAIEVEFAP